MHGETAALATAVLWTITAIVFEYAANRIGPAALNFLRLAVGSLFLGIYGLVTAGAFAPLDAGLSAWLWLGASGLVGLVLGDLLLFRAFVELGARLSMLIYALSPALAAILGFFVFGERIGSLGLLGMALTLAGISLAVLGRPAAPSEGSTEKEQKDRRRRLRGVAMALFSALCQAGGLILSKRGAPDLDAFAGTQVRVLVAGLTFGLILAVSGGGRRVIAGLRDRKALVSLVAGSFFGPFLGVSLSLAAIQGASTGIASSIMSLTPVLIIVPSVLVFREKITLLEVLGALVAVGGTVLLFL